MNKAPENIDQIKAVYFIGIGGIGMSAIAKYFSARGVKVSGYDRTETAITRQLQNVGINVQFATNISELPTNVDYVVYTPAIPKDNAALLYYQNNGYNIVKRSDILKLITQNSFNICVAGTHGKTTTSTMIAHLLRHSGYGCNAFLGGISANYNSNFWSSDNNVCVIEADEYDRSFLKLTPDVAVITAIDADHLDIYGNEQNVKDAFRQFAACIKPSGLLVKKLGLDRQMRADNTITFSLQNDSTNVYAVNIQIKGGGYVFDVMLPDRTIEGVNLYMGGMHNVENMIAAIAVVNQLDLDENKIKKAVADFKGVKRRFEYIIPPTTRENLQNETPVFIDDYAHHPQEIKALINGVKSLFPGKRTTLTFQPHLYSRTKDFAHEFAEVLDAADRVVLLPIYPAREQPIDGVTSELILDKMHNEQKKLVDKTELLDWIETDFKKNYNREFGEVLITAGAGDIDQLVEPIKKILQK